MQKFCKSPNVMGRPICPMGSASIPGTTLWNGVVDGRSWDHGVVDGRSWAHVVKCRRIEDVDPASPIHQDLVDPFGLE
jgi:hypothetical protein